MAISRLAISNPGATTDTLLHTATRSSLASIIATNKASTVAEVRVWVIPTGQDATPANWSYIAYDADITATNSLETFRFPVMSGDKIYVRSTTADVSFQIMGIYETGADTYVYAQSGQPTAPQVGDIWVDTASNVPSIDNTTVYRWSKTATGGETSLSGAGNDSSTLQYISGYEQVYLNGILLAKGLDYTASNGTSITSLAALTAGDIVEVISPYAIELTDVYTKSASDAKYDTKASNGLNLVIPTVVVGSGTGTVAANGQVSFSGATSVSLDGCFTSTYTNYLIMLNHADPASSQTVTMKMRSSGSDDSSGNYYRLLEGLNANGVTALTGGSTALTLGYAGNGSSLTAELTVMNPQLATRTTVQGTGISNSSAFNAITGYRIGGWIDNATQYSGFSVIFNANTTGTIRIYGYNNGGA